MRRRSGVDGFSGPDGLSEDGEFDEAQLEAIQFGRVRRVPEPSTGLLLTAGLGAPCAYPRARLGREAQRQPLGW